MADQALQGLLHGHLAVQRRGLPALGDIRGEQHMAAGLLRQRIEGLIQRLRGNIQAVGGGLRIGGPRQ